MKSLKTETTQEAIARVLARGELDRAAGGETLVASRVVQTGATPHAKHYAQFDYADGSRMTYGPAGQREYAWTRSTWKD